jgi:hypothetical protein
LKECLGYCSCAYEDALPFLRDILRLILERSDAIADKDEERIRNAHQAVIQLLKKAGSPAMQSWFVYALDKADLVQHEFNLYDLLIADRGQWLLDGLERFPEPPREEEAGAE